MSYRVDTKKICFFFVMIVVLLCVSFVINLSLGLSMNMFGGSLLMYL